MKVGSEPSVFVHAPTSDGPALVFLHGAGCDHSVWRHQTRRAAFAGFRAIAPDLPGHGRSGGEPIRTIDEMGEWVTALCDRLEVVQPILVGHSMGSLIALSAAAGTPVAGLVLIGTADQMSVHPELAAAADAGEHTAVQLIVGWSHTGDRRMGSHPAPGIWARAVSTRLFERHLHTALGVDLHACDDHDPTKDAVRVTAPTLIISGSRDVMTPASAARRLAGHLSHAEIVEIAGGSHMAFFEEPGQITERLLTWARAVTDAGRVSGSQVDIG